tara:strand:- start:1527 stop:2147 length:621 start_codon:yes stop_codon:yes gene_type:complete
MTYDLFADESPNLPIGTKVSIPDSDILHFHGLFAPSDADDLLARLKSEIQWQQEKIKLYGQVHDLPRLTAWYGDAGKKYNYSGIVVDSLTWIEPLLEIKKRIEAVSGVAFNSVLLNRYRSGADSVSWHADDEQELGRNPVIGSVSFGEARPFQLKHKTKDERTKIVLHHGSYLLMQGATQHNWLHQIPKSKKTLSERINLTFRRII